MIRKQESLRLSVTELERFRLFVNGVIDEEDFLHPKRTEAMEAGIAFHKWAQESDLCAKLGMPGGIYEVPFTANVDGVTLSGRVDCIWGNIGIDFKTGNPVPEWLLESMQWKAYTYFLGFDEFRYIYEEDGEYQIVKAYPYSGIRNEIIDLLETYKFWRQSHGNEKES